MKRFLVLLFSVLFIYIVYYDLNVGTLPVMSKTQPEVKSIESKSPELPYFEKQVEAGDTVLSIIEKQLNSRIPVSIDQVIKDFSKLNKGIKPELVQPGKTYRFPNYLL